MQGPAGQHGVRKRVGVRGLIVHVMRRKALIRSSNRLRLMIATRSFLKVQPARAKSPKPREANRNSDAHRLIGLGGPGLLEDAGFAFRLLVSGSSVRIPYHCLGCTCLPATFQIVSSLKAVVSGSAEASDSTGSRALRARGSEDLVTRALHPSQSRKPGTSKPPRKLRNARGFGDWRLVRQVA